MKLFAEREEEGGVYRESDGRGMLWRVFCGIRLSRSTHISTVNECFFASPEACGPYVVMNIAYEEKYE